MDVCIYCGASIEFDPVREVYLDKDNRTDCSRNPEPFGHDIT